MTTTLSATEARRVFLAAQGLARSRPVRRARDRDFAAYLAFQGVLQLDTVNVLARAHYLPFFSRLGPYSVRELDTYLWGDADGHSAHTFEHWGHEASVMPRELLPAMHFRMVSDNNWKTSRREQLDTERPGLIDQVRAHINENGPLTSNQVEHLSPRERTRGTWWDTSHVKDSLDLLFFTGDVASSRGKNFSRTYDATERAWGMAPAPSGAWGLPAADARQQLFDRALAACGIGLPRDLADHFRLLPGTGSGAAVLGPWAQSAVDRGLAEWVTVEGWAAPALLAVGGPTADAPWHRAAIDPGRATGAALLSPFDPVCWYRPRLERMFGMEYRIEIYTPAPKRVYGYYCLPFLLGDQMVGRIDLKADRKGRTLRVEAAWREQKAAPGARRRTDADIAGPLAKELDQMRQWLDLDAVEVSGRGDLALALTSVVVARA